MTTDEQLDLTPPTKKAKVAGAPKAPKAEKAPKAPKAPKEAKPAGDRAARKDYGYAPNSVIAITEKENKYRGARLEWFELLKGSAGKTAAEFDTAAKAAGKTDPSRGWLRFFVQDGAATLNKPEASTPAAE